MCHHNSGISHCSECCEEELNEMFKDRREYFLSMRNINEPCKRCDGFGTIVYASTATWHGGIGGSAMTPGPCNFCWGSGDKNRPWVSHKEIERLRAELKRLEND